MQKKKREAMPLAISVLLAMLAAVSIVAGKYLAFGIGNVLRFSFENLPILFAAMTFGPVPAALVAIVADLIGCLLVGYAINPVVTAGAAALGLFAGLSHRLTKRMPRLLRCILTVGVGHLIGSVLIKTVGLAAFYDMPLHILMLWRLLNYIIVGSVECALLYVLTGQRYLMRRVEKMKGIKENVTRVQGKSGEATDYTAAKDAAIEYIHSVNKTFCSPGLERIRELTARMGNPQSSLKFVHVAGTNGKGSTSCMLASVLKAAGYKVGLYTSPYIYNFNERIRVDGEEIPDRELVRLVDEIKPLVESAVDKPTEFELITAIAFKYFAERKCDIVVLEVGLGGRYDATNIIEDPLVSVITGISIDHTAFLGDTLAKIAYEKAGIIKRARPVVYGGDAGESEEVIKDIAESLGAPYTRTDPDMLSIKSMKLSGTTMSYKNRDGIELSLLGTYQTRNAMTVLDTIDVLREGGIEIPEQAIYSGISAARWKARFEILSKSPTVIYDGAHNPEGISVAVESIKSYYPGGRVTVISGVLKDKDYRAVAKSISEVARKVYTITPDSPRALDAEEYAEVFREYGIEAVAIGSVKDAVDIAYSEVLENSSPLFSLGSLYTYKEFTDALLDTKGSIG